MIKDSNILKEELTKMPKEAAIHVAIDSVDLAWRLVMRMILLGKTFNIPEGVIKELVMMDDEVFDMALNDYEEYGAPGILILGREDDSN